MRALLVEDDPLIGEAVRVGLARLGITVDWVRDGELGLQCASTEPFDAVVLDLGLPRQDGMQVLRKLRKNGHVFPILIITARDALADRVAGLDAGADDYILKPFELDELAAEVRHLFGEIPVFAPRPANEFKDLPQFSGSKQKAIVVARCPD